MHADSTVASASRSCGGVRPATIGGSGGFSKPPPRRPPGRICVVMRYPENPLPGPPPERGREETKTPRGVATGRLIGSSCAAKAPLDFSADAALRSRRLHLHLCLAQRDTFRR